MRRIAGFFGFHGILPTACDANALGDVWYAVRAGKLMGWELALALALASASAWFFGILCNRIEHTVSHRGGDILFFLGHKHKHRV